MSHTALNTRIHASPELAQRLLDRRGRIRLRGTGHDPRDREERVRVQCLEQIHRLLEEVDDFLLRGVVDVTVGLEGADAGAVFAPFVLPEGFVVAALVFPVGGHVGEEDVGVVGGEDRAYVCVLTGFVAV